MNSFWIVVALLLLNLGVPYADAVIVSGHARIIDGDTISINGINVRLYGIDAPETGQACQRRNGMSYLCGRVALNALREFIGDQYVTCEYEEIDAYDRLIGTCWSGQQEINRVMVRDGHAMAYVKYSDKYVPEEKAAQLIAVGIWQGEFEPPWEHGLDAGKQ